jgi:hypothetical protein
LCAVIAKPPDPRRQSNEPADQDRPGPRRGQPRSTTGPSEKRARRTQGDHAHRTRAEHERPMHELRSRAKPDAPIGRVLPREKRVGCRQVTQIPNCRTHRRFLRHSKWRRVRFTPKPPVNRHLPRMCALSFPCIVHRPRPYSPAVGLAVVQPPGAGS